jgi:adenosylmethionine---8-amino-7-oxononanoate aminotransferase
MPGRSSVWHPYTRFSALAAGLPNIVRAEGCYLFDEEGRRYVDAVSSWWACSLGHSHPRVVGAIQRQAARLQHSILGNLTHPPAEALAARLAALMPSPDRHVLFASDGASSVEAALKVALQLAHQTGRPERTRFVSIHEAYHGDTLGAVGVGYLEAFHHLLRPALNEALRLPLPACRGCAGATCAAPCFDGVREWLAPHVDTVAAVIVEPLCLGAAGMRMYGPAYLRQLAALCREWSIPLIVDEIAMGFGRTGRMFAFEHAGIDPDMVCMGKALTAGYLPMSALVVKDAIYQTFSDTPVDHTFYHGHTWSGNPIAAAAALETLAVYEEEQILEKANAGAAVLAAGLRPLASLPFVREVRALGLIGAVELYPDDFQPTRARRVQYAMADAGYLLRPLGDVLYLMPPLNMETAAIARMAEDLAHAITSLQ